MMANMRLELILPKEIVWRIDRLRARWGMSRSAFVKVGLIRHLDEIDKHLNQPNQRRAVQSNIKDIYDSEDGKH